MYSIYRYARAGERFRLRSRWMLVFDAMRYGWRRFQAKIHGHEHVEPLEMSSYGARTSFGVGMIHGIGAETGSQVLLIAAVGGAGSFFLQGVLYAASGLMVLLVAFPVRAAHPAKRSAFGDMAEGLRFAVTNPRTRVLLMVGVLPFFLLIPVFGTLYPIYAKDEFAAGPTGLGLLLTAVGVGGTLGGFIANALARAERQGLIQSIWVVVMAASIIGVALSPSLVVAVVFSVIGGAAEMAHASSNMAMLQMSAPEAMRGRISALLMLNPAFISLGALIAGPLSDAVGVRNASITLAAVAIAAIVLLYVLSSNLRELRHK